MSKEQLIGIQDFYCTKCGATTAILIGNKDLIRCMGCLATYCLARTWVEWEGKVGDSPKRSLAYLVKH